MEFCLCLKTLPFCKTAEGFHSGHCLEGALLVCSAVRLILVAREDIVKALMRKRTYRMFKPMLLERRTHLFVNYHLLEVLKGRMLTYFLFKRQQVFIHRTWIGMKKRALTRDEPPRDWWISDVPPANLWLLFTIYMVIAFLVHMALPGEQNTGPGPTVTQK